MNDSQKSSNTEKHRLRQIEDALIQNVLDTSGDELRAEIKEANEDPNKYIVLITSVIADAQDKCAKQRLELAKVQAAAFKTQKKADIVSFNKSRLKTELETSSAIPATAIMLAARKGKQLSERDEDALLRARAKLQKLETDNND